MADIVLLAVIRKAVDIASNLAIEEGSYLSKVKENINWLVNEMRYIQSYLEDVDSMQTGDRRVATLMSDIRDLGLDVDDILDKYSIEIASAKTKGFFSRLRSASGIFGYIYNAHNFVAEIEGIKEKVNDIHRRRQTYGIQERHSSGEEGTWNARRSFPHLEEPNIIGFEEHFKNLVVRMLDKDSRCGVVSIIGMAGLGKTTLAKKVYNSCRQSFECSAWICVSQQPNMAELLRDIARQVGLEKEKWEHDVEANLFAFLRHKRLHLHGHVTEFPEYDELPQNLTKLTLVETFLKVDPMETLKKLPKLKILKFDRYSYNGEKMMVCSGGGPNNFPQLQVLDITGLYNLKELLVEEEGMPQLAKLRIENLNLIMRIPSRIHDITEKVEYRTNSECFGF